jgi:hypothetical protein
VVLLWAVPAMAAAVGAAILLGRVRAIEGASVELLLAVHRTGELREPLGAIRAEMQRTGPVVETVLAHWTEHGPTTEPPLQS